jgi:tRNA(Ile)-lysidine synthetase-like protein
VSGGADSLALAAALAFERPGSAALVVDHGLQEGSADVAERAAEQCRSLGLGAQVLRRPRQNAHGNQDDHGPSALISGKGPEAAAREVRYRLLDEAATGVVLLGHTRDDQAEQVLLGLVRGSGARALAGMPAVRGRYRRPLLDLPRTTVRQACAEAGLTPFEDPHNADEDFLRVRVRTLLDGLDVSDGLVRSAKLLREDADALDALVRPTDDVAELAAMAPALRSRAIKAWVESCAQRSLTAVQVEAVRALVEDWRGQGPVAVPGGGRVSRQDGRLAFNP